MTAGRASTRGGSAGFTLIELVLAVGLSSLVLIGVFSIMTSMVQQQVESSRKGSVTGWALTSIGAMNNDIAAGSCLVYPSLGSKGDSLELCTNWSRQMAPGNPNGGLLDSASSNTIYDFCYDSGNGVLRGMATVGTCPNVGSAPPPCLAGRYAPPNGTVIATGVYRDAGGDFIFTSDSYTPGAIRLRYIVGNPNPGTVTAGNPGTNFVNPQFIPFDTKILMENWTSGN